MSDEPTCSRSEASDFSRAGETAETGADHRLPGDAGDLATSMPARLGRYTISRVLGEGGMGTVYEAEQENPRRSVALKVVRAGNLTPEMLRRFTQESRVLGRLQHPGIAQIYEAGTVRNEHGRDVPFFAMEFIKGVPLTEHVNRKGLGTRDRLELIARVCDAVYHAHQKGVIHRDLKPGNIMVDESGQPKVLDFGIARATDSDIQHATLRTDIGVLIGTIPYMSPEQVSGDPNELDTRSDVYALGVIAYELLAGRLPHDLGRKVIHEAARIIREEEPIRLSSINRTLRGDVETIVSKALEKDKLRRYQSAESLASDIRRYLRHEPITARPASTWYQLQKFSKRNTGLVAGTLAAFLFLSAGLVLALISRADAVRARDAESDAKRAALKSETDAQAAAARERERADELQRVSDFQAEMLAHIDPTEAGELLTEDVVTRFADALGRAGVPEPERTEQVESFQRQWGRVNATDASRELIDRTILRPAIEAIDANFRQQPLVDAQLRQTLARLYRNLGLSDAALPLQERSLMTRRRELGDDHPLTLDSLGNMGYLLGEMGRLADAEPYLRETLQRRRRVLGEDDPTTLVSINNYASLLQDMGRMAEAEVYYKEDLEKSRRVLGEDHPDTLIAINNMGYFLKVQGRLAEAEAYYREDLAKSRRLLGDDHPDTLISINNMGILLQDQGKLTEAESYLREVLERRRHLLGEEHPRTLTSINNLGVVLKDQGRLAEAEPFHREGLERARRVLGEDHPDTFISIANMGALLLEQGRWDEAEVYYREALEKRRRVLGEDHPSTLLSIYQLGNGMVRSGRYAEALPFIEAYVAGNQRAFGAEHEKTRGALKQAVLLYEAWDKADPGRGHDLKAAEWKAKAEAGGASERR